jgi:hypothetical protein
MALDPQSVMNDAKCFECLNERQKQDIIAYSLVQLAAIQAGTPTDLGQLMEAAKCFECLTEKQLREITAYAAYVSIFGP